MTDPRIDVSLRRAGQVFVWAWEATDGLHFDITSAIQRVGQRGNTPPLQSVEIRGDSLIPVEAVSFDVVTLQDEVRRLRAENARMATQLEHEYGPMDGSDR